MRELDINEISAVFGGGLAGDLNACAVAAQSKGMNIVADLNCAQGLWTATAVFESLMSMLPTATEPSGKGYDWYDDSTGSMCMFGMDPAWISDAASGYHD